MPVYGIVSETHGSTRVHAHTMPNLATRTKVVPGLGTNALEWLTCHRGNQNNAVGVGKINVPRSNLFWEEWMQYWYEI